MTTNPISAAGAAPSSTIASTRARKLPDISIRCFAVGFAVVSTAHRSLTTANARSEASSAGCQLADLATAATTTTAAARAADMVAMATRPGRGSVGEDSTGVLSVPAAAVFKAASDVACDQPLR